MTGYVNTFGGATLPPAEYREQTLSLTGSETMYWPYNYTGTGIIVAKLNSISSTGAYTLTMPDATQVANGEDSLWINNSAYTITIHDSAGGVIGTVAAGVSKYIFLKDNSTTAGTWAIFTFGTGTSAADASALAGYGLTATSATLSQAIPLTETSSSLIVNATTGRAQAYVFTSGSTTCTFPAAAAAGSDFFFYVKNAGTGTITLTPVGGEQIDDTATLGLNPNDSCIVFSTSAHWHTIGLGRSTIYQFTKLVKDLTGLSSYTLTSSDASNKLIQFTGAPSGATTITVPAVVSIYYVEVSTSNAYTVQMKTAAGTGITLTQSSRSILYCDGVNVVSAQTGSAPASQLTINNDTTTNASMYPVWVTAGTGDLPPYVTTSKMSFNPSTGLFTITGLSFANATYSGQITSTVATGTAPFVVTSTTQVANLNVATAGAVPVGGITGLGTGVATALAVNVGSAGAPVVNGGALGTPSSGILTNCTGPWGTVTAVSVATANGVSGTSSGGATPTLTISLGAITPSTVNGNTFTTGSSTYTGTAAQTYTFPSTTSTIAGLGVAQTWTAVQTFTNSDIKLLGSSTGATTFTSANAGASNYTITFPAVTDTLAVLGANTFTGAQIHSDQQVSRAMFLDCADVVVDKGNISNATVTFDYTGGSVQTYTATGSTVTWAFSNWPPTGNMGVLEIIATNAGAYTHSITGITWTKPDGTTTTTFATFLAANTGRTALQSSGIDKFLLETRDAGTTIYGSLLSI